GRPPAGLGGCCCEDGRRGRAGTGGEDPRDCGGDGDHQGRGRDDTWSAAGAQQALGDCAGAEFDSGEPCCEDDEDCCGGVDSEDACRQHLLGGGGRECGSRVAGKVSTSTTAVGTAAAIVVISSCRDRGRSRSFAHSAAGIFDAMVVIAVPLPSCASTAIRLPGELPDGPPSRLLDRLPGGFPGRLPGGCRSGPSA